MCKWCCCLVYRWTWRYILLLHLIAGLFRANLKGRYRGVTSQRCTFGGFPPWNRDLLTTNGYRNNYLYEILTVLWSTMERKAIAGMALIEGWIRGSECHHHTARYAQFHQSEEGFPASFDALPCSPTSSQSGFFVFVGFICPISRLASIHLAKGLLAMGLMIPIVSADRAYMSCTFLVQVPVKLLKSLELHWHDVARLSRLPCSFS